MGYPCKLHCKFSVFRPKKKIADMPNLGHLKSGNCLFCSTSSTSTMHPTPNKHKSTQSPHYNMGIAQDIIHTVIIHFFDEIVLSLLKYAKKCHPRHYDQRLFCIKGKIGLNSKINFRKTQNSKLNSILEFWTHMGDEELHTIFKTLADNLAKIACM